jgi:hypothetical protein
MVEIPFTGVLAIIAFALLVAVTGGVGYLTLASWRDRRLQEEEKRELRLSSGKRRK